MDAEHPHPVGRPYDRSHDDENWNLAQRDETEIQRLDRNWASLLQELRVVQTGVQLLTGFLLTLPFQQRFDILDDRMQVVYLATVCAAVASTALLIAPVAMHRFLFRRHRLEVLVRAAHRCAYAGLLLLAIAVTGMTAIIFDVVVGFVPAMIAGGCALVLFATFWLAWPFSMRTGDEQPPTR
ncbi:DUF6328 family protein [Mycolicibacterium iranicum]|uniref:Sodium:proton antiporter n=1 Tax=Mycolicibacterium iranicum TaxID=912594 RepID=A0A178LXJ2_MYCIR|nr:DUF6328 family protein [Mycolicibacterium iranicum]OAN39434.1 hypothetical protein A4X20_17270 [Mycolicibacterium iranicum]